MKRIIHKTASMKQIESTYGKEIEEILRELYVDKDMTMEEIAEYLHISYPTITHWIQHAGIYHKRIRLEDR